MLSVLCCLTVAVGHLLLACLWRATVGSLVFSPLVCATTDAHPCSVVSSNTSQTYLKNSGAGRSRCLWLCFVEKDNYRISFFPFFSNWLRRCRFSGRGNRGEKIGNRPTQPKFLVRPEKSLSVEREGTQNNSPRQERREREKDGDDNNTRIKRESLNSLNLFWSWNVFSSEKRMKRRKE